MSLSEPMPMAPRIFFTWLFGVLLGSIIGSLCSIIILSQENAFSTRCITFILFVSIYVVFMRWVAKRLKSRQSKSIHLGAFTSGFIYSISFVVFFVLTADYEDLFIKTLVLTYVLIASHSVMLLPEIHKLMQKKPK